MPGLYCPFNCQLRAVEIVSYVFVPLSSRGVTNDGKMFSEQTLFTLFVIGKVTICKIP